MSPFDPHSHMAADADAEIMKISDVNKNINMNL